MRAPKAKRQHVLQADGGAMVELQKLGYSYAKIGKKLGFAKSTVSSYLTKYKETGSFHLQRCPEECRPLSLPMGDTQNTKSSRNELFYNIFIQ